MRREAHARTPALQAYIEHQVPQQRAAGTKARQDSDGTHVREEAGERTQFQDEEPTSSDEASTDLPGQMNTQQRHMGTVGVTSTTKEQEEGAKGEDQEADGGMGTRWRW